MEPMIAALLAAVIAQPLDAEFSSAGHPRSLGIEVTLRHPKGWIVGPLDTPDGIARIASPGGTEEIGLWISDEIEALATGAKDQDGASAELRYVESGKLEEALVKGHQILSAGTITIDEHPARLVEFMSEGGGHQLFVGRLAGRRAVRMVVGGTHFMDYLQHRPMYSEIVKSIRVRPARAESSRWPWVVGGVVGAAAVVAGVRKYRRRQFVAPKQKRRR